MNNTKQGNDKMRGIVAEIAKDIQDSDKIRVRKGEKYLTVTSDPDWVQMPIVNEVKLNNSFQNSQTSFNSPLSF